MGGVDVHDQLRLQYYSVQQAMRFRKWYKQVFLGLMDMVLVNMFIIWRLKASRDGISEPRHYNFMEDLAIALINITDEEVEDLRRSKRRGRPGSTPFQTPRKVRKTTTSGHTLAQTGTRDAKGGKRAKNCPVCYEKGITRRVTTFRCLECDLPACNRPRDENDPRTCFQIHCENSEGAPTVHVTPNRFQFTPSRC